jgi:hypothetical protein
MDDDTDNAETGMMTPEERHRWRARRAHRGLSQYPQWPISAKTLRAEARAKARRKKRLRRKRNGSVQRRKVGSDDGRRARVKALKAEGRWPPPPLVTSEDDADDVCDTEALMEISLQSPPPSVYPGGLSLKPRIEQGTVRESFSKGRIKHVVVKKRGEKP